MYCKCHDLNVLLYDASLHPYCYYPSSLLHVLMMVGTQTMGTGAATTIISILVTAALSSLMATRISGFSSD